MRTAKKIIDEIERLPAKERRHVLRHLERSLLVPQTKTRTKLRPLRKGPYAALLDVAGTAHSDESDVSTDKYRHLGVVYGDNHELT